MKEIGDLLEDCLANKGLYICSKDDSISSYLPDWGSDREPVAVYWSI